jgi:hypothetical protein
MTTSTKTKPKQNSLKNNTNKKPVSPDTPLELAVEVVQESVYTPRCVVVWPREAVLLPGGQPDHLLLQQHPKKLWLEEKKFSAKITLSKHSKNPV